MHRWGSAGGRHGAGVELAVHAVEILLPQPPTSGKVSPAFSCGYYLGRLSATASTRSHARRRDSQRPFEPSLWPRTAGVITATDVLLGTECSGIWTYGRPARAVGRLAGPRRWATPIQVAGRRRSFPGSRCDSRPGCARPSSRVSPAAVRARGRRMARFRRPAGVGTRRHAAAHGTCPLPSRPTTCRSGPPRFAWDTGRPLGLVVRTLCACGQLTLRGRDPQGPKVPGRRGHAAPRRSRSLDP